MAVNILKDTYKSKVVEVTLGTDDKALKIGGESTLPFLHFEGEMPNKYVLVLEVFDMEQDDWPDNLKAAYADVMNDPVAWAKKCVEYGANMVALRLASVHPDNKDASPEEAAATAKAVADAINVPLLVVGCGVEEKDAAVLEKVAEALAGKNCLLGNATSENYKAITAAAMVHGHNVVSQSPLDINLAKQVNILMTEMGLPTERIVMDTLSGAVGYGIEYAYSIMERARLGTLMGDRMLSMPIIAYVGQETWKAKESKASVEEFPEWGDQVKRSILWEVVTAAALAQAGASIFVLRHPESLKQLKVHLDKLYESNAY
ncbi:acetyl-CoA decarbonylase/synthase complex subunit delta [Desulfolucanica intricata]|uniref:acetyl-CoA decarbonylase/synthase complex subunit delta n=1 Tax=Desulfolucanica intricata TaxID=1285191 RepID=UPI00082EEB47|nr:acetyl-CoA decarbonylase/synthase complex subunit delta [Desulfolucanica intricata]